MWMSLMTSGVKIFERPRMLRCEGAVSSATLEHQLPFGRLEVVVVVEHLPADELLELRRRAEPVDAELPLDQLGVAVRPLAGDAVDPERLHLAADVDRAVVHRVAEARTDVAAEDLPAALHHEGRHRAGVAEDDHRPTLLVDPRSRADAALHDDVAATERGRRERAGVRVDDDDARHHVLTRRPADAALDVDLRPVAETAAEVAERAAEGDLA